MSLRDDLLRERLSSYTRLRGGYPIPLAGVVYWAGLGIAGYYLPPKQWTLWAFILSGMIFPLALLFGKIFRVDFMRDKTSTGDVLFPAFVSMLLFWPMAFAAYGSAVQLVPLILAIGMSIHWPIIGWSYGRTALYSAHAIARALVCLLIWSQMPEARFTLLPLSVALIYVLTVIAIFIDSSRMRQSEPA